MSRPPLSTSINVPSRPGSIRNAAVPVTSDVEKPICSGNGVSCSLILAEPVIYLTGLDHEGSARESGPSSGSSILRGKLQLNVTKSVKIKAVTVKFTGRARTEWPEGIPPHKTQFFEESSLRTQVLPFFNAIYEGSDTGYGTLCNYTIRNKSANASVTSLSSSLSNNPSSTNLTVPAAPAPQNGFSLPSVSNRSSRSSTLLSVTSSKEAKRLSLQTNQSRSFQKGDSPFGPTPQQKGYKFFHPGTYEYNFELPIDNNSPETTRLPLASVIWQLEVVVERAGAFKTNLLGTKEIPVIRSPSQDSLELVEPISISRTWEDQLHYDIMISGKSFPLGTKIPIAFKLTPLAKVQVHKIKVYVSESFEYFTNDKRVTRRDGTRKILLLEKAAGKLLDKQFASSDVQVLSGGETSPEQRAQRRAAELERRRVYAERTQSEPQPIPNSGENILGDLELGSEQFWGSTEIEMNVQLPTCEMMDRDKSKKMAHDSTWKNAKVHHWIKIVMRISRQDTEDPTGKKRRHFEISIDSPFHILNCRATQANLALPEYSDEQFHVTRQLCVCGCPNAIRSNVSPTSSSGSIPTMNSINDPGSDAPNLAMPPQAHLATNAAAGVQRPIHLLRTPSFNPPPFNDEDPPPPMPTPPPLYDHVIGTPSHDGLADYFARLSEYDDDNTDEEDDNQVASRGRVNVANPRTPGGRIARSFELPRTSFFMLNPPLNSTVGRESRNNTPVPPT